VNKVITNNTSSNLVLTTIKELNKMRSKTFQRILDKMEKDPWWVKIKRWLIVELYVIKRLGIVKYIKNKKYETIKSKKGT
jgi:hypothetical protein